MDNRPQVGPVIAKAVSTSSLRRLNLPSSGLGLKGHGIEEQASGLRKPSSINGMRVSLAG